LIRNFNFSEEEVEKIKAQGEKVKKEAKKAQESVVKSADTIITKGNEVVNKIEDTELGFRDFIMNTWNDPITKKSQLTGNEIYSKDGDIYVVELKGVGRWKYEYNGTTFEQKK
jgi:hypothetical protein